MQTARRFLNLELSMGQCMSVLMHGGNIYMKEKLQLYIRVI